MGGSEMIIKLCEAKVLASGTWIIIRMVAVASGQGFRDWILWLGAAIIILLAVYVKISAILLRWCFCLGLATAHAKPSAISSWDHHFQTNTPSTIAQSHMQPPMSKYSLLPIWLSTFQCLVFATLSNLGNVNYCMIEFCIPIFKPWKWMTWA